MPPKKQKIFAPKQAGRKPRQPRNPPFDTSMPASAPFKIKLKLKLKPGAQKDALSPTTAYQFPLSAPPSDEVPEKVDKEGSNKAKFNEEVTRRGARQRTRTRAPDMVFGSEMDKLMSSATIGKTEDEEHVYLASSPPTISMHAPGISSSPVQGFNPPPSHYAGPCDQDVQKVLNTLRSSSNIQVDLPNMWAAGPSRVVKPYNASFLTQLYIQCYESHLWHLCDLIADTWIRALQESNQRSHKSKNQSDHVWRRNAALERIFRERRKGFKNKAPDLDLDVQDPILDSDVTKVSTQHLQLLYNHTSAKCGARLLWADAIALCGKTMENSIVKQPEIWPAELFYDVMCTSLRMVGRKLTLKIEEKYEGAWCRYHEHVKYGLPCYRQLAWKQKGERKEEDEDEDMEGVEVTRGEKRGPEVENSDEQGDLKRVRFNTDEAIDAGNNIDFGNVDAEGEPEEY